MTRPLRFACLVLAAACHTPEAPDVAGLGPESQEADVCAELLSAPPEQWPLHLPAVLDHGHAAHLIAGLERDPDAPGAQAALAALGNLGDPAAGPALTSWVRRLAPHAPEAALSLGRLPYPQAADLLLSKARDQQLDATLRTACACALIELGRGVEVSPLLSAVLLAGTPEGEELNPEVGLPRRSRWALERHMIILALRHRFGHDMGLDTDSPWPRLREGVQAMTRALQSEGDR